MEAYELVKTTNEVVFVSKINKMIKEGFAPVGGLAVFVKDGTTYLCQAMLKQVIGEVPAPPKNMLRKVGFPPKGGR